MKTRPVNAARAVALVALVGVVMFPAVSAAQSQSRGAAKHYIFDDEFSGKTLSSSWTAVAGANPSNQEQECYSPQNVSVGGGNLREKAQVGTVAKCDCPPSSSDKCPYKSGAIQWRSFSFTYGTVTFRAKFAGGKGTWPAVWLLGTGCQKPTWIDSKTCKWPQPGYNEIDIAEILGSVHTDVNEQIHTDTSKNVQENPGCTAKTTNVADNWHTYKLIWTAKSLTWEIDGKTTCTLTKYIPATPMFMIINTAVGGIGAGPVKASTLPQTTEIDYVRIT